MIVVPARMGRINKRVLFSRLQRLGVASRADLAKSLGMSQPTAGKIADELLKLELLEEVEDESLMRPAQDRTRKRKPVRLGRPGRMLRLNQSQPRFLGVQLGVAETTLALLPVGIGNEDPGGVQVPTPNTASGWQRQLRAAAAKLQVPQLWGVLVSVPGIVDEPKGRVLFSPNLHWTERADLPRLIRQVWDAPVELMQEERALALGHLRVDKRAEDFLLVDFGEGVGGAAILGGDLYSSPLPISGELGHTPVLNNKRTCGCGAVGCVETLVSKRGLLQSFVAAHPKEESCWDALLKSAEQSGVEAWLAAALDAAAIVIAGALNVFGLRRVVVTGTLTEMPAPVMQHLSQAVIEGAMWGRFGELEVEGAARHRMAGLVAMGIDRVALPVTPRDSRSARSPAAFRSKPGK